MKKIRHYLKQCAAWAIALREKYASDFFFRTTLHIVALQGILVLLCIGGLGWAILVPANALPIFLIMSLLTLAGGIFVAQLTLSPTRDAFTYQKIFMSNVAHELRTPLSTIKTSTEVALLDGDLSGSLRRIMSDILGELDRISEIVNNLLSLNTLVRPERMRFRTVDLSPIIDRVIERHRGLARERDIQLIVEKEPHLLVSGNETALEQVCTNLVKNALSYTPQKSDGRVVVSATPDYRGGITFAVSDTGIGMSEQELTHVFEPFYRADTSRVRNIKKSGSGLGLTIVNEIVRIHQGSIHIESAKHKGTTVVVILPLAAPPKRIPPEQRDIRSHISIDFSKGQLRPSPERGVR